MQIKLQNIGIIRDSVIALDGLTVITGKNDSGKTTVGKTLYALLEGVTSLRTRARADRNSYIRKRLRSIEDILSDGLFYIPEIESDPFFTKYPKLRMIMFEAIGWDELDKDDLEQFAQSLEQELKDIAASSLDAFQFSRQIKRLDSQTGELVDEEISLKELFKERLENALDILEQMFADVQKDPTLVDYARESVNQTLQVEFSSQIQPVKAPSVTSEVTLSDNDDSPYFHFSVVNNSIVNDGQPIFFSAPCKRVFMIDDPFILDASPGRMPYRGAPSETVLDVFRIQPHNYRLRQILRSSSVSVFEQTLLNDSLQFIKGQIDQILPGTFEFSRAGDYYVQDGAKIKTVNLATGSKMFSILKILLEKGKLDKDTMLILDEPEAHLHPKWQNAFAEVIALLVKKLDVNILLTTHSPNFMLALDAYMRKYELNGKTNFYQTDPGEDGFVSYRCVNDDLGVIYDDFLQYLSQVKLLRDQYLHGKEGEQ